MHINLWLYATYLTLWFDFVGHALSVARVYIYKVCPNVLILGRCFSYEIGPGFMTWFVIFWHFDLLLQFPFWPKIFETESFQAFQGQLLFWFRRSK